MDQNDSMREVIVESETARAHRRKRYHSAWPITLGWIAALTLTALTAFLVLLTTLCSKSYFKAQVRKSSFDEAAYSLLYDNFVSYGAGAGFSAEVMTSALDQEKIASDMEQSVDDLFDGNTALEPHNEILNDTFDNMIADLNDRGIEVTDEISGAVVVVADACRDDYSGYVCVPLASQLYTLITKVRKIAVIGAVVTAVLCAAALLLTMRMASTPKMAVRCLIYTFAAAAVLCLLAATVVYPMTGLSSVGLQPTSLRLLVLSYIKNLLGRFGVFAAVYAVIAGVCFAMTGTAGLKSMRRG